MIALKTARDCLKKIFLKPVILKIYNYYKSG